MPKRKPNPRAPDIDVLARHYLQLGLRKHPDAAQHVSNVDDIEDMPMLRLMNLAKKLGVDADSLIERTEAEEHEISRYSSEFPGFRGELEFDLSFAFLGKSVTRKAKVVYEHTPEWEYFDLRKKAPYTGWEGSSYHIEVAAVPEEHRRDGVTLGEPYWVQMHDITSDDVLPHDVWDAVLDAVDEKCKLEDAERRRVAAAQKTAPRPSRRRH